MSGVDSRVALVVRTATPEEHDRVGELTFRGFGHDETSRPDPAREALLRDAAARAAEGDLLVAADGATGALVGTASLLRPGSRLNRQARDGEAELRLLAVLPHARRSGAGWALMTEAIARARAWGVPALVLDTGPTNHASQRLYDRLGFVRVPERETQPALRGGFLAVFRHDLGAIDAGGAS
nr:GNAT family N-acetyltransferase [Microbacterium sp. No. 7]